MHAGRSTPWILTLALVALLGSGCGDDSGSSFMEVEARSQTVASLDRVAFEGGDQRSYIFQINSDMGHPEVRANWTVLNREVFIDMYLLPADAYVDTLLPPEQPGLFYSSVPSEGPLYGGRRGTSIILHPCQYVDPMDPLSPCRPEGRWMVIFYSDNLRTPTNRTELSATVQLRFFR